MPTIEVNGAYLAYEETGSGPPIVLSHGLLMSKRLFDPQVARLACQYRCFAYDHRGHGESIPPLDNHGIITVEDSYRDAVGFIEQLGIAPCHFIGFSLGGFIGLRVAARRPDLLRSLVILNSSGARQTHAAFYHAMSWVSRWLSRRLVVGQLLRRMFTPEFRSDPAHRDEVRLWRERLLINRRTIWRSSQGVLARESLEGDLERITVPTLIIAGEKDALTPVEDSHRMHKNIRGSQLVVLPDTGHASLIEQPERVNALIEQFLKQAGS